MTYLIPDRKAVGQLNYQLRRFEKQCAELPAETRLRVQQEMQGLRRLLGELEPERCSDWGGHCRFQRMPFSRKNLCITCHTPAPEPEVQP